ncbi:hypothetical protein B1729_05115 [Microbacterium sp. B35-04]|uniref:UPF0182 family membrane protein n=1 Tax=unclassified Microbacterium TaxID=2609290 RepID=UPI0013D27BAA|nr:MULTISPECIES: UPF0182 family protein [unclassified Microbacterium]KAF2414368.1 hypothetical protein B1729_05115 [Microbacterium sp. B35-04]KAF2415765.1 hypothetical protein B2K11_18725 [Microbacterium sp. B35-30]
MTTTSSPPPATPSRTRRVIAITLAIIAALVVAFFVFASLYADWLWFDQLGFTEVLLTQWIARVVMFVVGFLGMAVPVWLSIQLAYRLRPVYARLSSQLDRYQEVVEPLRRLAMWGIPVFFGFFAGFAASAQWETTWLWFNGVATDTTDPEFHLDTGFYMFAMPFWSSLIGFASAVLLICLLVTALVSYLYGSVRVGQRELRISKSARIQLAVIAGLYLLVQAASLWLDRYKTLVESGADDRITGPGYTGVNAIIPGQTILAIVAVIVAILFFVTAIIGRWRYPLIATALLVVSAIVVGVGYPWVVNTFQVQPNRFSLEEEFYQRNVDMTHQAYGVSGLAQEDFAAVTDAEPGQLRDDAATTAQVRIMDPAIISPNVRQLEQYRSYYQFADPLDVDRYERDGVSQDTVVSVRELNLAQLGNAADWQNSAVVYTHGYGIVVAKGNDRTGDGDPVFLERGIPASGFLTDQDDFQPRVYFGESSPPYSIVGAPADTPPAELDYPEGGDAASGEQKTTFEGDGGPSLGNVFNRLVYALKFQAEQILFSDYVNSESQILYDRNPRERVQKVAPYLTLDNDAYPSVVDGRIVWIIDGYTLSANYPYSSTVSLTSAISDSSNPAPRFALDDINYIRNSVKATVDAYDGSVTLYAWDEEDPLLQAWQKVYPSTIEPISEMSADLMSHVRYPTDLFKVQRTILGVYHVDDARSFYQSDNRWQTPNDPQDDSALQPPYYLTMQMPGEEAPTYSMFTSFIPSSTGGNARNVLMGYLAVNSNAGAEAGVKNEDYGKLRMLVIDADTPVSGPGQVQNDFDSQPEVSSFVNILKQGDSDVLKGNLLTLPVGGGLLYVQPVFVQSSGATKLPKLQKVLVSFGTDIAFEDTLTEALDTLFGGDSGADAGDTDVEPTPGTTAAPQPTPGPTESAEPTEPTEPAEPTDEYQAALQEAQQALVDRQTALEQGDWAAYGEADARLTTAIERLIELGEQ